jgi:serine/threonine protein kinase
MSYNFYQGTAGFRPLELATVSDKVTKHYMNLGKLGSATNIWTIGQSILTMMNREPSPKTNAYERALAIPTFNANAQHVYSKELRDLLSACVRYRPEDRITTQGVLDAISQHTAGDLAGDEDQDLGGGMRAGQPTSEELNTPYVYLFPKKEHYRLGMSYEEGERLRVEETTRDDAAEVERLEAEKQRRVDRRKEVLAERAAQDKANREAAKAARGK